MASDVLVLPGDEIPVADLRMNTKKRLVLGPGLRAQQSSFTAVTAGTFTHDQVKNAIWVEHNGGRYIPRPNDLIIATVHHSSTDMYHCTITPHAPLANLPQLAFESATRKTRPQLAAGALVYTRVSAASGDMEAELSCVSASTGKADGLGPLKGGMVFDISLGFARRLLMSERKVALPASEGGGGIVILEALAEKLGFEVAVGRNGRLWVDGDDVKTTLAVGRAVGETDGAGLGVEQQRKLAGRILRELGV